MVLTVREVEPGRPPPRSNASARRRSTVWTASPSRRPSLPPAAVSRPARSPSTARHHFLGTVNSGRRRRRARAWQHRLSGRVAHPPCRLQRRRRIPRQRATVAGHGPRPVHHPGPRLGGLQQRRPGRFRREGHRRRDVTLTGTDDLGHAVNAVAQTDANGVYAFANLRPSKRPATPSPNRSPPATSTAGTRSARSTASPSAALRSTMLFSGVVLHGGSLAENYNFGERPATTGSRRRRPDGHDRLLAEQERPEPDQGAQRRRDRDAARQLAGGHVPEHVRGTRRHDERAGRRVLQDAVRPQSARRRRAGRRRLDAQVMATALAVYVTNQTLAGNDGRGLRLPGHRHRRRHADVQRRQPRRRVRRGQQHQPVGDGPAVGRQCPVAQRPALRHEWRRPVISSSEASLRTMANDVFSAINEAGGI